jgi:hypothetical protein
MRKLALITGIIWLAGLTLAGAAMLTSGQFQNVRGLMYAFIGASLPAILMLHWGMGKREQFSTPPNPLAPKAPYDRAAEAGHIMRMDPHA